MSSLPNDFPEKNKLINMMKLMGMTQNQIKIYLTILKKGPITVGQLAKEVGIHRANAYKLIDNLKELGMIEIILGRVNKVVAVPLDRALDILLSKEEEKLENIRKYRLRVIKEMIPMMIERKVMKDSKIFARLLIGKSTYSRFKKLVEKSEKEILQVVSARGFLFQTNIGITDVMVKKAYDGIAVKILTEVNDYNFEMLSDLSKDLEMRHHTRISNMLRYVIVDRRYLLLKMAPPPRFLKESLVLWSNSPNLIEGLRNEFKEVWSSSLPVRSKV